MSVWFMLLKKSISFSVYTRCILTLSSEKDPTSFRQCCSGLNCVLNHMYLWMWPYGAGDVFADLTKLRISRWDHPVLQRWALNLVTALIRRGERKGRKSCDGGDRDWSYTDPGQGMPGSKSSWKRQVKTLA